MQVYQSPDLRFYLTLKITAEQQYSLFESAVVLVIVIV